MTGKRLFPKTFTPYYYIVSPLLVVFALMQAMTAMAHDWNGTDYKGAPWVKNVSRPYAISHGLEGRHLTLWASHGRYYDQNTCQWRWQRPALYTTCEDLFTQTIVVPYLIPMLENAGAVVFTPRERDWQRNEVIVDNNQLTNLYSYRERDYRQSWTDAPLPGFAWHEGNYLDGENPFVAGTARMVAATKSKTKHSTVFYQPTFPETGSYAVYVSYQTVPKSIPDAHYTVYHQGEKTEFRVNQQMGGSTWVYLGTFQFDAGSSQQNRVMLTNQSDHEGYVTADAVRFGGGMGNIERGGTTSGMPRCLEGARYYAQWAGMPYDVYSSKAGLNDYADDINARSLMLNYLCGGSAFAPDSFGRKVPIELSLAVHSDAGYNKPDAKGVYGSLSICTTQQGEPVLGAGQSRQMSYDLAAELLDNTANDLRLLYGTWEAREIYDRNYSETRLPIVPSAILETMSHQNYGDMLYGLNPDFRFSLARSVYKTLVRYVTKRHGEEAVIQPLVPHDFRIEQTDKHGEIRLAWSPTIDAQEPSAVPTGYVLYTAVEHGGFDNGQLLSGTSCTMRLEPGRNYHFRIAAANKGGVSFASPVLSACYQPKAKKTILIVNGFHRLASPAVCQNGFDLDEDPGVSYGRTCGIIGRQQVFDLAKIGVEDSTGLGYSSDELAGHFIAGNDFNYVRTHADAISISDEYNIVSCSSEAIGRMPLYKYDLIDLILGLEKDDGHSLKPYKTFSVDMQNALSQYTAQGGRLLVSGAFVGSDMHTEAEQRFLTEVLKCQWAGYYRDNAEDISGLGTNFKFHHQLNEHHYAATCTDILLPACDAAFSTMAYANGTGAATAYRGHDYRTFVTGFPLECIQNEAKRNAIMQGIVNFLLK